MKAIAQTLRVLMMTSVFVLMLVVVGCAPNPESEIISPELGAQLAAKEASAVVEAVPTPEPLRLASMTQEEITAGLPAEIAAALEGANPANGETAAMTNACIGCHSLDPAQQMTGPTWHNMGDTAANRVPGESPAHYLYNSIVSPNVFVNEGYPSGVMPQNYGDTLDDQTLADLISYLLSQREP